MPVVHRMVVIAFAMNDNDERKARYCRCSGGRMNSTHHQLLFGVLALQMDFITPAQFAEACTIWASRKDRGLPDLLAERGWIEPQDKSDIDRLVSRRVERHCGDVLESLLEAGRDPRVH